MAFDPDMRWPRSARRRFICRWSCRLLMASAALLTDAASVAAFPWSIDMFRGESIQPLAVAPRVMPPGTLPTSGGEPPMSRQAAALSLHNPFTPTPKRLARGKKLFEISCAPCHGSDGKGNGSVRFLLAIPPANLTRAQPTERSDGYLYSTIRDGSITMPPYGDALSPEERWNVVLYLRWLQGKVAVK